MYECYQTPNKLIIDGDLTKPEWQKALKSQRFVDVIGGNPGIYDTRSALLWDKDYLYVAFWCEEPYPQASIDQRDDLIWFENDIEVFIDGGDTYYELQVNALNTIYEVFYIWKDAYLNDIKYRQEFDILQHQGQSFGGNHDRSGRYFWVGSHPRGNRWAFRSWDLPGLKTAVKINGKLNDPTYISQGWTVEIAFPWSGLTWLANGRALPPMHNDVWRLFLGRYQKMLLNGQEVHVGWAWDMIGTDDNHYPEKFTPICFKSEII
jgi:hypothetical protein